MTDPSIEDLQKQLADLKASNDEQKAKLDALNKLNTENTEALKKARDLNTKLLLENGSFTSENEGEKEQAEDTIGSICDEIVEAVNKKYLKGYGINDEH